MSDPVDEEPRDDTRTSSIAAGIFGAIFTVAALVMFGPKTALSVAIGAGIAVANLLTMRAIVRALVVASDDPEPAKGTEEEEKEGAEGEKKPERERDHRGAGRRGGAAWGVFAVLKIFLLFGGIWILLTKGLVAPIPLVVGYGVLPLGIAAAGLWSSLKPRR